MSYCAIVNQLVMSDRAVIVTIKTLRQLVMSDRAVIVTMKTLN